MVSFMGIDQIPGPYTPESVIRMQAMMRPSMQG